MTVTRKITGYTVTTIVDMAPGDRHPFAFNQLYYRILRTRKDGLIRIVPRNYWYEMNKSVVYWDFLGPHLDNWE